MQFRVYLDNLFVENFRVLIKLFCYGLTITILRIVTSGSPDTTCIGYVVSIPFSVKDVEVIQ